MKTYKAEITRNPNEFITYIKFNASCILEAMDILNKMFNDNIRWTVEEIEED